jgi:cellulose synthase/poly-beta-1,6-N-acetylglucosamine synthase-like glycosyltransferase
LLAAAYVLMTGLLVITVLYRRFLLTPSPIDPTYRPKVALLLPVRGLDPEFESHLEALFALDYPHYEIVFGVAERDDPAYPVLAAACERHPGRARLVITGIPWTCSEKIHNLLGCVAVASTDAEVLVVVDGDVHPAPLFLQRLVTPLRDPSVGAVTGYRWLVATEPSLARLVATMANAAGAVSFWFSNNVWGGTLAIRREVFERLDVTTAWRSACSDDLILRRVLVGKGLRVVSIADGLAVSHQDYTWSTYWEFLVRQLIIVRVYTPSLWWQVLALYAVTIAAMGYGLVGTAAWLGGWSDTTRPLAALPLLVLYMLQGWIVIDAAQRAIARRGEHIPLVRPVQMPAYLLAVLVGSLQLLASTRRRWINWRGVVYHLDAPDRTAVFRPSRPPASDVAVRIAVSDEFVAMLTEWASGNGDASKADAAAEPLRVGDR